MLSLDHVVASTRDLDRTCDTYERLGFTVSSRADHPVGTMRNLLVFETTYYELLAYWDGGRERFHEAIASGVIPPLVGSQCVTALENREGPCLLGLQCEDPEACKDPEALEAEVGKLAERGVEVDEPLRFQEHVVAPDGPETLDLTLVYLPNPDEPDASLYVSQQHNRKAVWASAWQQHRNGAVNIASVTYVAERPLAHAAYFTAIFGEPTGRVLDDELQFRCEPGRIIVTTPARFRSRFEGLDVELPSSLGVRAAAIRVRDIDVTRTCLEGGGVAFTPSSDTASLYVRPESPASGIVEFVQDRKPEDA